MRLWLSETHTRTFSSIRTADGVFVASARLRQYWRSTRPISPAPGFGPVATSAVCSRTPNNLSQRINTSIGSFEEPEVLQCITPHTESNALRHPGLLWDLRGHLTPLANSRFTPEVVRNLYWRRLLQAVHTIPLANKRLHLNSPLSFAQLNHRRNSVKNAGISYSDR